MEYILIFLSGLAIGALGVYFLKKEQRSPDEIINSVKESLGNISMEALSKNSEEFLKLANQTLSKQTELGEEKLDKKKELIDQSVKQVAENIKNVQVLVNKLEKDREQKFGSIENHLKNAAEQTEKLRDTANTLKNALASSKARGQWGERMAEDVLRLAGFIEGVNYLKQKMLSEAGTKPDYTFLLPQEQKVNMDVKFPLDNYLKYLETESETDKETFKHQFLKDVKARIKEVTSRDYINPADNTVDYVICFIPNEQVYAFINEKDQSIIDEALKNKVIMCSPITLYAILAVIRQAVDNFKLETTASKIAVHLSNVKKQWEVFINTFDKMGRRLDDAQREFVALTTTRKNMLDKPLQQIEDIRTQEHFSLENNNKIMVKQITEDEVKNEIVEN